MVSVAGKVNNKGYIETVGFKGGFFLCIMFWGEWNFGIYFFLNVDFFTRSGGKFCNGWSLIDKFFSEIKKGSRSLGNAEVKVIEFLEWEFVLWLLFIFFG